MGGSFAHLANSGPLALAVAVAAVAGLVSFLSPCVLPLVPGYLSYVTGLAGADLSDGGRRGRVLAGTLLFIAGFAGVFVLTSVLAAQFGRALLVLVGVALVTGGWVDFVNWLRATVGSGQVSV